MILPCAGMVAFAVVRRSGTAPPTSEGKEQTLYGQQHAAWLQHIKRVWCCLLHCRWQNRYHQPVKQHFDPVWSLQDSDGPDVLWDNPPTTRGRLHTFRPQ